MKRISENPFLMFLPFLVFLIIWVIIYISDGNNGDEAQYRLLAQNLLHGSYALRTPDIIIPVGPGYPIILMPFIALQLPLIFIALLNAVFYYLSIVFLFKALRQILPFPITLVFSLFWALYYSSYQDMKIMQPEIFTSFLITLLAYSVIMIYRNIESASSQKKYVYISGFVLGYLVLTKVVFGYVMIALIIGVGALWIFRRDNVNYRKGLLVLLFAFAVQTPFLIYTHHITGKWLYYGTTGGDNLYWMSNPNEGEFGDWNPLKPNRNPWVQTNQVYLDSLKSHHQKYYDESNKKTFYSVAQDQVGKDFAINNIKAHPVKFIQNCFSNAGRLLFDYPYTYKFQSYKDLFRVPFNAILVVVALFCMIPTLMNWRRIIFPIRFLLFFVLIYLGGTVLGSAETRMFTKIVPLLLLWIAFVIQNSVKINWKFDQE